MGITDSYQIGLPGGWGGTGGSGNGAALFNGGTLSLVNCTIASNMATGAAGGDGGMGGFGLYGGSGGNGGAGGNGFGGIYDPGGLTAITNCTIALNASQGGAGGSGGGGGFGPYGSGRSGASGIHGIATGGLRTVGGKLMNTLLATNTPTDCLGTVTDAGNNLSSDASSAFTGTGSLTNTDPKLGPLADNGGPTFTMALLPSSPAIDAGSTLGAPATDQRGIARPQGPGVDIGAFEYQYIPVFESAAILNPMNCQLQIAGLWNHQSYTLQVSSNLLDWAGITNGVSGTNGVLLLVDPVPADWPMRFYRLKAETP